MIMNKIDFEGIEVVCFSSADLIRKTSTVSCNVCCFSDDRETGISREQKFKICNQAPCLSSNQYYILPADVAAHIAFLEDGGI